MKALEFKEQNCTFAADQPEYLPLPGHKVESKEGSFIFCMGLSFWERLKILFRGKIWVSLMTFNKPLTPSYFTVDKWDMFVKEKES
ncbi:MAG TPA: hypothetical protein ENH82_15525 [bacterium]|nr:hypothetical protein [bacterium]